jgi:hypothetical protein
MARLILAKTPPIGVAPTPEQSPEAARLIQVA